MARVLQFVTELVVGGASLTMLDFSEDLAAEHELHIAHGVLADPGNAAAVRARARFPTYELPQLARPLALRPDGSAIRAFNSLCRELQPDLIHTHSSKAGFVGRIGAPPGSRPLLHTIHGWGHTPLDSPRRRAALVAAERICALRTTKLIAVSPAVRDEGLALRIGRARQYTLIGVPVDMRPKQPDYAAARAAARAALGLEPDAEVIGWVGRLSAQKDPQTLTEVFRELLIKRHNAYAVLVGEGPERASVEASLAPEIAARRVLFTGERDDVRALYPAFDVLVHTSLWEGNPRVVREALAERVPVVTADVGGTSYISNDARLGAEVEPRNAAAYITKLGAILDSGTLSAPIEESALTALRATAGEPYTLMRELYRGALQGAGGKRT
jgi:glycosyltransferase involved in cell wall biosynthesis